MSLELKTAGIGAFQIPFFPFQNVHSRLEQTITASLWQTAGVDLHSEVLSC